MLNKSPSTGASPASQMLYQATPNGIPVFKPSYSDEEVQAVAECLQKGWTGCGPKVKEFEDAFAQYIGTKYAVSTNSCTASLHLSLKVLGLEGAEVISTPMTFVSTNHAILYNNAVPVLADIDKNTLNIDPHSIEKLITPKTKALIVVHFGGNACDMEAILAITKKHKLFLIEDVAHACGGTYDNQKLGSFGDLGCFSFHAVKNLATGDGGMITTNDKKNYNRLMKLRWVGISRDTWNRAEKGAYSWDYQVEELGFKYQMNDITAAIGLVQLQKLEAMNQKRRDLAKRYREQLQGISDIETLAVNSRGLHAQHNFVIKTSRRDDLMTFLKGKGISTGVHYRPNHHYPMYESCRKITTVVDAEWTKLVTLPLYPDLGLDQQDDILKAIRQFFSVHE